MIQYLIFNSLVLEEAQKTGKKLRKLRLLRQQMNRGENIVILQARPLRR